MAETKTGETKAAKKLGFNDKGEPYKGVDLKTGERVTVVLSELKHEFGPKRGEEMYRQIGQITGTVDVFGKHEQYAPDIQIAGADQRVVDRVNEILSAKE